MSGVLVSMVALIPLLSTFVLVPFMVVISIDCTPTVISGVRGADNVNFDWRERS
jgi:hypothetical protein